MLFPKDRFEFDLKPVIQLFFAHQDT